MDRRSRLSRLSSQRPMMFRELATLAVVGYIALHSGSQ
jgi:hypothetical protein